LAKNDIDLLIVSYHTLAADHANDLAGSSGDSGIMTLPDNNQKAKKRKATGATLFDQRFHRVILDEAHTIRSIKTCFFKAATSLHADHKLCLTGTPFVNRPGEFYNRLDYLVLLPIIVQVIYFHNIFAVLTTLIPSSSRVVFVVRRHSCTPILFGR
jgi:SNF2 family DNA or RNA helicase